MKASLFTLKPVLCQRRTRILATDPESSERSNFLESMRQNPVGSVVDSMVNPDEGYEMVLFPFIRRVKKKESAEVVSEAELSSSRSAELEKLAAAQLINLDMPERTRRKIFGGSLLAVALAIDVWLFLEKAGFWSRFATSPLLVFGVVYLASGQVGLCNIAQSGMWQIEGEGLKKIKDKDIARRIKEKVDRFNVIGFASAFSLALLIAAIPL